MDENAIDKVITICIAAGVGAILVCSFVLPVFDDMFGMLTTTDLPNSDSGDIDTWKSMLGVVVIIVIVAFMVAIIRGITTRSR